MWNRSFFVLAIFGLIFTGCTSGTSVKGDPKKVLSDYISRSFSIRKAEDRSELIAYLTGDAKARLQSWSDEQFSEAFVETKREFVRLLVKEIKSVSPTAVNITYELTFYDQSKGKNAKVTNKKLCNLVQDQGQWLIADVHNIKELIEYQNEMALP